jgi:hypothetical protein
MKKTLVKFLFFAPIAGAVFGGVAACEKPNEQFDDIDPNANCYVFVSTIPNQETILLAKSGLTVYEAFVIHDDFKSQYGNENIWRSVDYPGGINDWGKDYLIDNPDAVSNCYEFTMTIDFSGTSVPSIRSLIGYGFRGVRINGNIATCKKYHWAYTDEMAENDIQFIENSWNSYAPNLGGGTIVGTSTAINLGPYLENEPIIF